MAKPRLLTIAKIGSAVVMPVPMLPHAGERVICPTYSSTPEGRGAHTVIALARLGNDSLLAAKVGADPIGQDLLRYLNEEQVDTRFVIKDKGFPTSLHIRLSDEHDEAAVIEGQGASEALSPADITDAFISYPDGVVLYGNIPADAFSRAIEEAERRNIPVFIMSGDFPSGKIPCECPRCEVFSVNADDVFRLTGIQPADQERCMKACLTLYGMVKAKYILLRLENRGCFYFDGTYYHFISGYNIVAKNKNCCDNSFIAGFVTDYLANHSICHGCEYGELVSAVYLSSGGGLASYPTNSEIQDFAAKNDIVIPDDNEDSCDNIGGHRQ